MNRSRYRCRPLCSSFSGYWICQHFQEARLAVTPRLSTHIEQRQKWGRLGAVQKLCRRTAPQAGCCWDPRLAAHLQLCPARWQGGACTVPALSQLEWQLSALPYPMENAQNSDVGCGGGTSMASNAWAASQHRCAVGWLHTVWLHQKLFPHSQTKGITEGLMVPDPIL